MQTLLPRSQEGQQGQQLPPLARTRPLSLSLSFARVEERGATPPPPGASARPQSVWGSQVRKRSDGKPGAVGQRQSLAETLTQPWFEAPSCHAHWTTGFTTLPRSTGRSQLNTIDGNSNHKLWLSVVGLVCWCTCPSELFKGPKQRCNANMSRVAKNWLGRALQLPTVLPPLLYSYCISPSFFLSAGLRGRFARPSSFQPARPPPCVSERTALGCLLTNYKVGAVFSCSKPHPLTLGTPRIPASSPGPYGYQSSTTKFPGACFVKTLVDTLPHKH